MRDVPELIAKAAASRCEVINAVDGLSAAQAGFKPAAGRWSLQEQVEHLVLAEHIGTPTVINFWTPQWNPCLERRASPQRGTD